MHYTSETDIIKAATNSVFFSKQFLGWRQEGPDESTIFMFSDFHTSANGVKNYYNTFKLAVDAH